MLLPKSLGAEDRNVFFKRIAPRDGLPAATVHQVYQDREGYLWLATQDGLSRFDGHDFLTYRHDPRDPSSLPHNDVWSVLQDQSGTFWIGTDGGGLSRLDEAAQRFQHFQHNPVDPTSLSGDRVLAAVEGEDGSIWVGTFESGLNRLDPDTGTFSRILQTSRSPLRLSSDRIRDLHYGRDGRLWIATDGGGVNVLDVATGEVNFFNHRPNDSSSLSSDRVRALVEDRDGSIWIGTYNAGLNRLDPVTGNVDRYQPDPNAPTSLSDLRVGALFVDGSGSVWVGTGRGLSEWRQGTDDFVHHRHSPANPLSLSDDTVTSIYQDRGAVLWVGTANGLNSWNTTSGTFLHEFRGSSAPTELSSNYATSFAEDSDGSIWVGTRGGGLNLFDRSSRKFRQFRHDPDDSSSLSQDVVMSLLVDSKDALWAGTMEGGLNRLDPATGRFTRFAHDPDDATSLGANGVTSILEDRDGDLWVGTYGGGLNRFDAVTATFERFAHDADDPRSLSSDRVLSIYEDDSGVLWVATENAGLNRFDRRTGRCRRYLHDPRDGRSLSSDHSWFVTGDERGDLWIGTDGGGLNQWRAEDRAAGREIFRHYLTSDGLPSSVVYAAGPDREGNIWVSSAGGLSKLAPNTGFLTNFDIYNGLQSDEFNHSAWMRARDGEMFFGGINGFNHFFPERVQPNSYNPPVVLTSFEKFNQPFSFDQPVTDVRRIELGHKDSVIAFRFAALDFTAPEKNRYRYRLEGFDEDWIDAGTSRRATYTNLDAGEYVFRVQGSNSDGVWSDGQLEVGLEVAPAPWRTWWAYCFYALAAGVLVQRVVLSYERKRRRAEELERINLSLTREISDRKAKEAALEAEKRKAREYLDVAEVIMLAIDLDGKVVLINQKGCRILDRVEGEIVGRDWVGDFVPPRHQDEVREKLADVGSYQYYEYPVLRKDGEERVIAWHSANLPASGDDPPVILSSGADTTQVRELEKQVRFHQKMDALGTLAGGVAHDFNNILTAIFGYSTLTLGQLSPQSEEAGYMGHVVKACERAKDLVARILTFSRRGDQEKRPIEIADVVTEATELLRSSLPATVDVVLEADSECLPVMADATQIHQVVMNLGTNAGQAMQGGGRLQISVQMVDVEEYEASRDGLRPGPYIVLVVEDSGQGMDQETLEKVFDPFFTTKGVGEGTGLGLSVVHGIITSHGGDISVTSREGAGSRFVVRLPCTRLHSVDRQDREEELVGKERILIVDDEPLVCDLGQRILESLGYSAAGDTDSKRALETFLQDPEAFDLVVTDQTMPDLTGLELVREMRRVRPELPVIITSGRKTDDVVQARDLAFLQKPFSVAEIGSIVRRVLDGSPPHRNQRAEVRQESAAS